MLKFGTDGVRGKFGSELTENYVANLAVVVAEVLDAPKVLVGRDTRESGSVLEAAITRALTTAGVEVGLMGVAPTPAIAFAASTQNAVSISITASHNPYSDNGIKVFGRGGRKLSEAEQQQIEHELVSRLGSSPTGDSHDKNSSVEANKAAKTVRSTRPTDQASLVQEYCEFLLDAVGRVSLKDLHVVLDCANGAFSKIASTVFVGLGAKISTINDNPDGRNINLDCGATHPAALSAAVRNAGANFGVAFDGDGDRLIAADENGSIVDGDHLMAMSAIEMKKNGVLRNNSVAVTVMTNIGFHRAMKTNGIAVVTTPVGDRAVLVALEENDLVLGGEQSGHIIYRDLATTGDGLLAALVLARMLVGTRLKLSEIASSSMTSFPQVLRNVKVSKQVSEGERSFAPELALGERLLGQDGRVLVRASGTENLVRVMVEATEQSVAESVAAKLVDSITSRLGG